MKFLIGCWRILWGFCPVCNSDAKSYPKPNQTTIDNCDWCAGYRGYRDFKDRKMQFFLGRRRIGKKYRLTHA